MPSAVFILVRDGLVLMEQRPAIDSHFPNEWLFPGGKMELRETAEDAMLREANEELGIAPLKYRALDTDETVYYARPEQASHRLYPYLVEGWAVLDGHGIGRGEVQRGSIPTRVIDSGNVLEWRSPLAAAWSPVHCTAQLGRAVLRSLLKPLELGVMI
jgi:mutator protein MutT